MILDIMILVIFSLTIFFSMRKGFMMTLVSFLRGIACLVAAWFLCDDLADLLSRNTGVFGTVSAKIREKAAEMWTSSQVYELLPDLLKDNADSSAAAAIDSGAARLTELLLTILCFFLILLVLRLLLGLLVHAFSRRHRGGFVGAADWFLGILMGVILGAISVLLFLAVLFPAAGLFIPSLCPMLSGWLEESYFVADLYNNNLLLILFRDFAAAHPLS